MRTFSRTILATGLMAFLVAYQSTGAAATEVREVVGVDEDDMLKLRAGPGTGYEVILGLPNGTALRVHSCERTGSTRWCRVSLDRARNLNGFVSEAYLRQK